MMKPLFNFSISAGGKTIFDRVITSIADLEVAVDQFAQQVQQAAPIAPLAGPDCRATAPVADPKTTAGGAPALQKKKRGPYKKRKPSHTRRVPTQSAIATPPPAKTAAKDNRFVCPDCGKDCAVKLDGTIRKHKCKPKRTRETASLHSTSGGPRSVVAASEEGDKLNTLDDQQLRDKIGFAKVKGDTFTINRCLAILRKREFAANAVGGEE